MTINSYSLNDYHGRIREAIFQLLEKGMYCDNLVVVVNGTYFVEDPIIKQEIKSIDGVEIKTDVTLPYDMVFVVMERINYEGYKYYQEKGIDYGNYTGKLNILKVEIK